MTIDELYQDLLPYAGKPLNIPGDIFAANGNIGAFCSNLLNGNLLVINVDANGVVESGDKTTVTLTGNTDSYGFGTFDVTMVFTMNVDQYSAEISIVLKSKSLSLPGVTWFGISDPGISFTVSNAPLPVVGTISGNVEVNGETMVISMTVPSAKDIWAFTVVFDPLLSIPNILKFIGGANIANSLQDPFASIAGSLGVKQVGFSCNTATVTRESTQIEIGTPNNWQGWTFAPGVTVTSADLSMTIDAAENIAYNITSSLTIEGVDISLFATYPGAQEGWTFGGQTGEGEHISLTGLINEICSLWGVTLPTGFPSISFLNLNFSFNTQDSSFQFGGEIDITNSSSFPIAGKNFEIDFILQVGSVVVNQSRTYNGSLRGLFQIGTVNFELDYDFSNTDKQLTGFWKANGDALNIADVAGTFGSSDFVTLLKDIPPSMDLALTSASFTYDFTNTELVFTATSKNYGNIVFIAANINNTWVFAILVAISKIDLTQLPIVGSELGKLGKFEIDNLNLLACSGAIAQTDIAKLNGLIAAAAKNTGQTLPTLPDVTGGLQKGVNLSMTFEVADITVPVQVGTATSTSQKSIALPATTAQSVTSLSVTGSSSGGSSSVPATNAFWINIQKSLGPVYIDKIGFTYADGDLDCLFNFSLKLGTLSITLDGLTVGLALADPLDPSSLAFALQGMSLSFIAGPVEISGGFIKQNDEYNGEALIKVGTFMLSALGSYAKYQGHTSLFIFASITNPPLGGPPAFFVTGVAAGFGYNRGLKIPTIDQVTTFPLISGFVPGQSSPFSGSDPGQALQVLVSQNVVPIEIGENWLAAGIQFTSFEMLNSFALLSVAFGTSLEIALLGVTTASVPTGDPNPVIYAQLALEVRILPDEGLISVEAQLTSSSYLLTPSCHITGGFAFYIWFGSNDHAGDFVITLGGYNTAFAAPNYYPQVPRLGFNWIVTSELTIKGGIYFALTPSCFMIGGEFQALWQSGGLKAWFDMGADFLISWKPYHYEADLYLSFGVSYTFKINLLFATVTETISISLGADLTVWGPSFSGVAHIHLWVISFSVSFGDAASQTPPPIDWSDFEQSFIPKEKNNSQNSAQPVMRHALALFANAPVKANEDTSKPSACIIKVTSGLITDLSPGPDNPENINWIVKPQGTVLETSGFTPSKTYVINIKDKSGNNIPSKQIVYTNPTDLANINVNFGVGPVDIASSDFGSKHEIDLVYNDGDFSSELVFNITAIIQTAPIALWQQGSATTDPETLIKNVLIGFSITTAELTPDSTPLVDADVLSVKDYNYTPNLTWPVPTVVAGPAQPAKPITQLESTIKNPTGRPSILQSLLANNFDIDSTVDVSHIAAEAGDFLLAAPVFAYDYWKAS